jgi:hypothetical protein
MIELSSGPSDLSVAPLTIADHHKSDQPVMMEVEAGFWPKANGPRVC